MNWSGVSCLVTGGAGFIGSQLVDKLIEKKARVRIVDDLSRGKTENISHCQHQVDFIHGDLTDMSVALRCIRDVDFCFHLAAIVGGVGFMKSHPARMCKNISIDHNTIEACRRSNVERLLYVSSACVYPISLQRSPSRPLKEEDALKYGANPDGHYGWCKLLGEIQCRAFHEEHGMKIAVVRPFNPYGPRESFNPKDSHVIPALVRKAVLNENPFVVWGSGKQEREFTYVTDLIDGMVLAIENLTDAAPINLGTGEAISIGNLAELIVKLANPTVQFVCDTSKPQGVISRIADITKAREKLGWKQKVNLEQGLRMMIAWYKSRPRSVDRSVGMKVL